MYLRTSLNNVILLAFRAASIDGFALPGGFATSLLAWIKKSTGALAKWISFGQRLESCSPSADDGVLFMMNVVSAINLLKVQFGLSVLRLQSKRVKVLITRSTLLWQRDIFGSPWLTETPLSLRNCRLLLFAVHSAPSIWIFRGNPTSVLRVCMRQSSIWSSAQLVIDFAITKRKCASTYM